MPGDYGPEAGPKNTPRGIGIGRVAAIVHPFVFIMIMITTHISLSPSHVHVSTCYTSSRMLMLMHDAMHELMLI